MVHPSAATTKRPAGTIISSPKGWYDAGDYNKYIVNSGFTLGLILQSYQLHQDRFNSLNLQIPESDNKIPDILDEMMYNLEWMLTMQDPTDGGVYHKLTTPNFEGFVMPEDCKQQRYVVQKTTTATLDFAATKSSGSKTTHRHGFVPIFIIKRYEKRHLTDQTKREKPRSISYSIPLWRFYFAVVI